MVRQQNMMTIITIIIRSITKQDDKYYYQLFLDDCLYKV